MAERARHEATKRHAKHQREAPSATFAIAVALLSLCACTPAIARGGGYCAPPAVASFSLDPDPAPPPGASREAHMAALLGLGGVIADQAARGGDAQLHVVARVQLATVVIEATAAELDCEGERAEQTADYLTRGQTGTVQALTVASVAAATLTSIAGVLLSTNNRSSAEQDTVAISGGVLTGGLALGSLFVHPRTDFTHPRNLLADVWTGPQASATYPPFVWAYLTRASFSNRGDAPIREKIVARWKQFKQIDDPATAAILFGAGGSYDEGALRARAAMLDEVKAEVELAHQDLAALAATLLR